jgi:hypothetical protein
VLQEIFFNAVVVLPVVEQTQPLVFVTSFVAVDADNSSYFIYRTVSYVG